jgi:hypothetical protein
MKYTPETLAALLNGREYGSEITREEADSAEGSGLVVVFGYSDDNTELRGAIHEEVCCYGGGEFFVSRNGSVFNGEHDCECEFCGFKKAKEKAHEIKAVWGEGEYSWSYKTDTAHATFEIVDEDEKYCLGIVFRLGDIK